MRARVLGLQTLAVMIGCAGLAAGPIQDDGSEALLPSILAIGESTTGGYGVPADRSYPAQLEALLGTRGYAYRVVNYGRNGLTTSMALSDLDRGLRLGPRIVIIALGGNDRAYAQAREVTRANLHKLISLFVRTGARVFLADRTAAADGADGNTRSLFADLAAEDGAILMPSLRQGVAGRPELLLSDGIHPNAAGYTIVAEQMFDVIEPYLDRSTR